MATTLEYYGQVTFVKLSYWLLTSSRATPGHCLTNLHGQVTRNLILVSVQVL